MRLEEEIVSYLEPVLRFCTKRLQNRHDAEDLAGEIMVHILDGVKKYPIESLQAWVWRIAHNRYARFIKAKNRREELMREDDFPDLADDYDFVDALAVAEEYENVFKCLHSLSKEYRNILVDYYIGEIPVRELCRKYSLPESTVKWRLNISREKIKKRMGESQMDKVYTRINWNTTTCNGSMDSNQYLFSQVARAICEAAYEKPLTVEEISLKTGLPAMYIEDELPRLLYGDAMTKDGNKYATNFIILHLRDQQCMETKFAPLVGNMADYFEELFAENVKAIAEMSFYGADFGMQRLGYIAVPACLRNRIQTIRNGMEGLADGKYPPRQDGGYGWFIVEETRDEQEQSGKYGTGCNATNTNGDQIYYYWVNKYFHKSIYHNGGTRWLHEKQIPEHCENGAIPAGLLSEDDIIRLLKANLIRKDRNGYMLNFACFTSNEFHSFAALFNRNTESVDKLLTELILEIHRCFKSFVPKRLDGQINQWVSCYVNSIIGYVAEDLIDRGLLEKPGEKPLTNGVFFIEGEYIAGI